MRVRVVRRSVGLLLFVLTSAAATAQPYSTNFDSFPNGTKAEALAVPGMTFTPHPGGIFAIADVGNFDFELITDSFLYQETQTGSLDIAFASPVRTLSLLFAQDANPGTSSLVVEFFAGATSLGTETTVATAGSSYGEGIVSSSRSVPFDRIRLSSSPGDTLFGIDNVVAGGSASCPTPGAPQLLAGAPSSAPSGSSFAISWSAATDLAADGIYIVDTSFDASFGVIEKTLRTPARTALVPTEVSGTDATLFVRVRAVQSCGAQSPSSTPHQITLAGIPASFLATSSSISLNGVSSDRSSTTTTLGFKNVGGAPGRLSFSQAGGLVALSFFPFDIPPGGEASVVVRGETSALGTNGVFSGSVLATGGDQGITIPVTLTVIPTAAPEGSRPGTAVLASTSTVSFSAPSGVNPPPQTITLSVPKVSGPAPVFIAPTIGPGGSWLTLGGQISQPLPPSGGSLNVTLSVDRSKRTAADGIAPVVAIVKLLVPGADLDDAAVVLVTDNEPLPRQAGNDRGSAAPGGLRALASAPPSGTSFIVPTAVKASGAAGAFFTSDGWLKNEGAAPVSADFYFTPDGKNGLTDASVVKTTRTIPGGNTFRLSDLLASVFAASGTSGQVEIRSATPRSLSLRTTVESVTGGDPTSRYGTEIPTVAFASGIGAGEGELVIPGIDDDAASRANLILTETTGAAATATLTLNDSAGTLRGTITKDVPPYGKVQINDVVDVFGVGTLTGAWIGVGVSAGAGRVLPIATVIDNKSNSFSAVKGRAPRASVPAGVRQAGLKPLAALPGSLIVPSAVRLTGAFNTSFFTALAVVNGTGTPATVSVSYNYVDVDDGNKAKVAQKTIVIPPRGALPKSVGADVLVNLFGVTNRSFGWMKMEGDVGKVVAVAAISARVDPNDASKGVKTAQVDGVLVDSADVLKRDDPETRFAGTEKSVQRRTNVILVEVSGAPCEVLVKLNDTTGRKLAEKTFTVAANQYFQINDVFGSNGVQLGDGPFQNVEVTARVVSGGGRIIGVATVNDNISRNPEIFVLKGAGPTDPSIGF